MSLLPAEITTLRDGHPHTSRFYFSVLKPQQVYCGTISGSPAKGDRTLTLVDVSGNIANLEEGITLYVGTSAGDKSVSKRRYRSRALQVITLDENAVTWAAGQYVTAYKNWELWPVYPYITPASPFVFYKDRDLPYNDLQNDHIPPVAIAGGPFVGFLIGGGITFNLDASRSYPMAVGAGALTYLWTCDGGTIANPNIAITTITFTVANANGYWLDLTVTDTNGKTQTIHTPIFVHGRSVATRPVIDFAISSDLQGDWKSGGYDMGVELWDKTVIDDIIEGAYCVLWKESHYAGTEEYLGNNGNIQFAGYITEESITRSPGAGMVSFNLCTVNGILDKISMPSVSLEESAETATWYRFPVRTLTVSRAIHHLWRWHSTLFSISDVFLPILLTDTMPACDDFENGSLYSMVDNFSYQYSVFAKVCCDFVGRVYVEQDINILNAAARAAIIPMMTLEDIDRRADTDINFTRNNQKIACVVASGIMFDGSDYVPIISACPGSMYSDMGIDVINAERLVLHDQAHANVISGRLFSLMNQDVLEVSMDLAGDYPVELVPQVWWVLADMNTKRIDIDLENTKAVCRNISFKIDLVSGTVYPSLTFEPEALDLLGSPGDTIGDTITPPIDPMTAYLGTYDPFTGPGPGNPISITTVGRFGWSLIIGNGASIIPTGIVGMIEVPYNCVIDSVKLVAKVVGSVIIDIWLCTYADIAIGVHPVIGDSITGGNSPSLVAADKSVNSLVGWTTQLYKGDWLFFNVDSVVTLTLVTLAISGEAQQ